MKFTLGKDEKLKSRKLIEKLYNEGDSFKKFPLRIVYLQTNHTTNYPAQVGFSVPKRNFKLAVHRNRIKRLMRETYRLQKLTIYDNIDKPYVFMISYIGKKEFNYLDLYNKMSSLLNEFIEKTQNSKKNENK